MRLLVLFAIFLILATTFAFTGCTPEVPDAPVKPDCNIESPEDCCPEVAGRYHLRGRTKRFFGRVS
jgi:hypothetical protein